MKPKERAVDFPFLFCISCKHLSALWSHQMGLETTVTRLPALHLWALPADPAQGEDTSVRYGPAPLCGALPAHGSSGLFGFGWSDAGRSALCVMVSGFPAFPVPEKTSSARVLERHQGRLLPAGTLGRAAAREAFSCLLAPRRAG